MSDAKATATQMKLFKKAQRQEFDLQSVLDSDTYRLLQTEARQIGCADELLFFPLLSAVASLMTPNCKVEVHKGWREKVALSCFISARRGERKTAALTAVKTAVRLAAFEFNRLFRDEDTETEAELSTNLVDDMALKQDNDFVNSFRKTLSQSLINATEQEERQEESHDALIVLDDFGQYFQDEQLLKSVRGHANLLKDMYDGICVYGPLLQRTEYHFFASGRVNFTAVVQPSDLVTLFSHPDRVGLLDRTLVACAPDMTNMTSSVSSQTFRSSIGSIQRHHAHFTELLVIVMRAHDRKRALLHTPYMITPDGKKTLDKYLKTLQNTKDSTDDEKRRGSISQAAGQIVRLAAVMAAMKNAIAYMNREEEDRTSLLDERVVNSDCIRAAFSVVKTVLKQKFCLFPDEAESSQEETEVFTPAANPVSMATSSSPPANDYTAAEQTGSRLSPRREVPTKQPVTEVVELSDTEEADLVEQATVQGSQYLQAQDMAALQSPLNGEGGGVGDLQANALYQNVQQDFGPDSGAQSAMNTAPVLSQTYGNMASMAVSYPAGPAIQTVAQLPSQVSFQAQPQPEPQRLFLIRGQQQNSGWKPYKRPVASSTTQSGFQSMGAGAHPNVDRYASTSHLPDLYNKMEDTEFLRLAWPKIKKLLMTQGSSVSAAFACQYRLFPPLPKFQRKPPMKTSHPVWAAVKFFERIVKLELGTIMKPPGYNLSVRFKKTRLEHMSEYGRNVLKRIYLSEEDYERSYPKNNLNSSE